MGRGTHLAVIGGLAAVFDAWGIGANDVSNSLATAVNSGVMSMKQAAIAAPIFEFLGAVIAGGKVVGTISKGIMSSTLFAGKEGLLQLAFTCALLASSSWLQIANRYSLPVSTTHSIIGATIGVGVAAFGAEGVQWGFGKPKVKDGFTMIPTEGFGPIWVSWFTSPLIAGVFAGLTFWITQKLVLEDNWLSTRIHKHSFWRATYVSPFFYAFVAAILVLLLAYKGVNADSAAGDLARAAQDDTQLAIACVVTGVVVGLLAVVYVSWWQVRTTWNGEDLQSHEWLYHFALGKRPTRPGFNAAHQNWVATRAAAAATAAGTAKVAAEEAGLPQPSDDPTGSCKNSREEADAAMPEPTLDQMKVTIIPPEILAAQAVADKAGYVIREKTETEKVLSEYKVMFAAASWKDKILMPIKLICCFGIFGAGGKEREVQHYGEDDPEMKKMHAASTAYDPQTEMFFQQLQIMTSLLALFAHGSNDTANAMGPFTVIYGVYRNTGDVTKGYPVETWILAMGGAAIGLGFLMYGYHLMRSLGNHLTLISPARGYCMEFGAAITVILASQIGLPISTTQCITGATICVGIVGGGARAVNLKRFVTIFGGWVLTVPLTAIWSGLIFAFCINSANLKCPTADDTCQLVDSA